MIICDPQNFNIRFEQKKNHQINTVQSVKCDGCFKILCYSCHNQKLQEPSNDCTESFVFSYSSFEILLNLSMHFFLFLLFFVFIVFFFLLLLLLLLLLLVFLKKLKCAFSIVFIYINIFIYIHTTESKF